MTPRPGSVSLLFPSSPLALFALLAPHINVLHDHSILEQSDLAAMVIIWQNGGLWRFNADSSRFVVGGGTAAEVVG